MHDIDLIPGDFRRRQWQRRWIRWTVPVVALICGAIVFNAVSLYRANSSTKAEIAALTSAQQEQSERRARLQQLLSESEMLTKRLSTLTGLRSGASAEQVLRTVDRAIASHDVWFVAWEFQRDGVVAAGDPRTVNTGYFIVVPKGAARADDTGRFVRTNMTIRGRASDHSALSGFVKNLFAQPEIEDVRVQRTFAQPDRGKNVVNFELAVVLTTRAGNS